MEQYDAQNYDYNDLVVGIFFAALSTIPPLAHFTTSSPSPSEILHQKKFLEETTSALVRREIILDKIESYLKTESTKFPLIVHGQV